MADANELYLAVMPIMHLGPDRYGLTEQTLTLFPNKDQATEFFADEVDTFIGFFQRRIKYLVGGHVSGYDVRTETLANGRVIVRVIQKVTQNVG
ncbi:MAG TPA: hypothetical protein VMI10_05445 [Terriglobales bacterium]|nr:hypothetical protein [Terriglobales bacterium]